MSLISRRVLVSVLVITAFAFLSALVLNKSEAAGNPLIGSWKRNVDMTLQNLRIPTDGSDELKNFVTKARQFVEAQVKQDVFNMTMTYSDKECLVVLYDKNGHEWSRELQPYSIIDSGKKFVVVKQLNNGATTKHFFEGSSYFIEMRIGQYTYKDYFSKLSTDNVN